MTTRLFNLFKKFLVGLVGAMVITLGISQLTSSTPSISFYYAVTDLGTIGNDIMTYPLAINDEGQVVGYSQTDWLPFKAGHHAFLWQNGMMSDLGSLGGTYRAACGINNLGQVVGYSQTNDGTDHAFLWQDGTITDLGTRGGKDTGSVACGINDAGQVVGMSYSGSGYYLGSWPTSYHHAFLWEKGTITDLENLTNKYDTFIFDINNAGQVVGILKEIDKRSFPSGFLWQDGVVTKIGPFESVDVNNSGQIAATSLGQIIGTSFNSRHAALWQINTITDLGTIGGSNSHAFGINDAGTVVGYSKTKNHLNNHAFVWRDGIMKDINDLLPANSGWELISALDINNNGQIVGFGKFNGRDKAFLLTPVTVSNQVTSP